MTKESDKQPFSARWKALRKNGKNVLVCRFSCFATPIFMLRNCDSTFIASPQRLYRDAAKALSHCDRASIANSKGKNRKKMGLWSLTLHVFGLFRSLFRAFWSTLFCCEICECTPVFSSPQPIFCRMSSKCSASGQPETFLFNEN